MQVKHARFQSRNRQNTREDEIKNLIRSHYAFFNIPELDGKKAFLVGRHIDSMAIVVLELKIDKREKSVRA